MTGFEDALAAYDGLYTTMKDFADTAARVLQSFFDELPSTIQPLYTWMKRTSAVMWLADHGIDHPAVDWLIARLPEWMLPEPRYLLHSLDT